MNDDRKGPVLVVGAGFIGSHVAEALVERQVPTRVVTRSSPKPEFLEALGNAELLVGDVTSSKLLAEAIAGVRHVVFCAGGLTPADSTASPMIDIQSSLTPLLAVLSSLRDREGVGITYLSSGGTVYGSPIRLPIDEQHPTDPIVPYGISKLAGEKYVALHERLFDVPGRILRCSNVYGERQPTDRNQGVVAVLLESIRAREAFTVVGDGSVVRDYVYVRDVAKVVSAVLELGSTGPALLNVGSGEGYSVSEVIAVAMEITGESVQVQHLPARVFDVPSVVLDISLLQGSISYQPRSLREGMRRTWVSAAGASRDPVPVAAGSRAGGRGADKW